jgi:uncharacterized Fe-S cluster-containing radical SAM superfamily protein
MHIGEIILVYNAVERHLAIEKLVTRKGVDSQEKKYYRIRPARWYGGIVTADCVGCGLLCKFCWVRDNVMLHPSDVGRFYTPKSIADSMISLARKYRLDLLRISGGEPTIGKKHLLQLLDALQNKGYRFILETNGIPIAYDADYAESLSKYSFVHVRVSLKGCCEEEFAMLTSAKPKDFNLQLTALKNLVNAGVSCHPSVMASFSRRKSLQSLMQRLRQIDSSLAKELEIEELILYSHVVKRIGKFGLKYYKAYSPDRVPSEQI